jgi:hypothetical protein
VFLEAVDDVVTDEGRRVCMSATVSSVNPMKNSTVPARAGPY